jgi:hypothetical protein
VDLRAGLEDVEERKAFKLPGLELRPLSRSVAIPTGTLYPLRINEVGREAHHSPPSNARVIIIQRYLHLPLCLHGMFNGISPGKKFHSVELCFAPDIRP